MSLVGPRPPLPYEGRKVRCLASLAGLLEAKPRNHRALAGQRPLPPWLSMIWVRSRPAIRANLVSGWEDIKILVPYAGGRSFWRRKPLNKFSSPSPSPPLHALISI